MWANMKFNYFLIQTPAINSLRSKLRYGEEPNNPQIITLWLMTEQTLVVDDHTSRWHLYCAEFYLLLDTISDNLLPMHWRQSCLDNIYRPLTDLNRISFCESNKKQLKQLWHELNVISHYFQENMSS